MNLVRPATAFGTLNRIAARSTAAVLGWSALRSQALRAHLLASMPISGDPNAFLAEPIIEAAHGWATTHETFGSLSGSLLSESVVAALDGGGLLDSDGRERYRLPRDRHPYTHQLATWRHLLADKPRSVLVTSGTGSGKTECFLVPLLEHLARAASARGGPLRGVRALMLYPLNALINSQRERLSDWTRPFEGDLRFCLYNGETPNDFPAADQAKTPEEVRSRHLLRRDPPPVLVTNITMLEYMLVRKEDQPILQRSQGQLRYIILDEAHSYVGSQAAELSLLLRRVIRAFGVEPEQVRFVATSATIGRANDLHTHEALAAFLADVAGVSRDAVSVIEGHRQPPTLPPVQAGLDLPTLEELTLADPLSLFDRLGSTPAFQRGFASLVAGPRTATEWFETVGVTPSYGDALLAAAAAALKVLPDKTSTPLQPLKVHGFHRTQGGLWACANVSCAGRTRTHLDAPDWSFGTVFQERLDRCSHCESPVFEVVFCNQCGETALDALREADHEGIERLTAARAALAEDEFLNELVEEAPEGGAEDLLADPQTVDPHRVLITSAAAHKAGAIMLARATGEILDVSEPEALTLPLMNADQCPHCGVPFDGKGLRLQNFRVSGPFLLGSIVPELVSGAEPLAGSRETPGALPADGRQILTFTDSRQGTARLAAKLQRDAERNHVRALLYHGVQAQPFITSDVRQRLDAKQAELAQVDAAIAGNPVLASVLALGRRPLVDEIARLQPSEARLTWADALQMIQKDETCRRWIQEAIWTEREAAFANDTTFARFLILREVIRQPRTANSLETMGLLRVCFRHIEETITTPPGAFTRHEGTLADWRDFLTLALTRVFRGNVAVDTDRESLHWIMPDVPKRFIVPPGSKTYGDKKLRAWPQPSMTSARRPIIVSLLAAGLKLDFDNPAHRDDLIACMGQAWEAIWPLLKSDSASGTQLDPEKITLAPVRAAYLCPVTRRIIDRTFRGLSHNPRAPGDVFLPAEPIAMPSFPFAFGRSGATAVEADAIEAWLDEDADVRALRQRGHWSDLHDRIARRNAFYRSAEHSAQQPGRRLRAYEKAFRRGHINVLNCSTTMEMGVDIGSIGTVLMTNVPPSAASYRQRVGRAGRRGQAIALSLTLCKHRPTELSVFRNPLSLLTRTIAAPSVSLDSAVIAQRHVNALLLARFLAATGAELPKLEVGYFYGLYADGTRTAPGESPAEGLLGWVDAPTTRADATINADLQVLLRGTPFEARSDVAIDGMRDQLGELRAAFEREWDVVRADLLVAAKERSAAHTALKIAMQRLTGEYLLAELASHSFLPAHGFPTNVVPFDNSTPFIKERRTSDQDDDATKRMRHRDAPSRQLDLAIRDYAPGSEIVLDGIVYRSAGVRLDWKRPASESSVPEIQSLRHAWRCERCGATDTAHRQPEACPSCGEAGRALKWHRYLRPSGFTCDPVTKPHSEIESVAFVPPRLPWVAARGGEWTSFSDSEIGRFRASRSGMVFHYTTGATEHGYAVCLCCGRAAPETGSRDDAPPLPGEMLAHRPLRTSRKDQPICDAQDRPFAIQRHHYLGHETITDVLELQLTGLEGPGIGYPIAAALRDALAQKLGVEPGEIGFAITQTREAEGAEPRWSIFLFDRAAGGAGFSVWAVPHLVQLLESSRKILDCRHGQHCRYGCVDCVLSRDLENQAIDRIGALAFMTERVLPRLAVPIEDRLFAPDDTFAEMQPLADAIMREMERHTADLTLWIDGDQRDWDIARWAAVSLVRRLALRDRKVEIIAPKSILQNADESLRVAIFGLLMRSGATVRQGTRPHTIGAGFALARVGDATEGVIWASRAREACLPGSTWGGQDKAPIVRGRSVGHFDAGDIVDATAFLRPTPNTVLIEVGTELNGAISAFGSSFWRLLIAKVPRLAAIEREKTPLAGIDYSDRYLLAPLPLRLIIEVISHAPGRSSQTMIALATAQGGLNRNVSTPNFIEHDWQHDPHCYAVTEALLKGLSPRAMLRRSDKRDLAHGRTLILRYADGSSLRIMLDQGVGYWRPLQRGTRFDFQLSAVAQVDSLRSAKLQVQASSVHRTYIVVTGVSGRYNRKPV